MNDRGGILLGLFIVVGLGLFLGFWFGWDLLWSVIKYSAIALAIAAFGPRLLSAFHRGPTDKKPRPRKHDA